MGLSFNGHANAMNVRLEIPDRPVLSPPYPIRLRDQVRQNPKRARRQRDKLAKSPDPLSIPIDPTMIMNALTAVAFLHPDPPEQFHTLDLSGLYDDKYNVALVVKVTKGFKGICGINGGVCASSRSLGIALADALTGRSAL
jgi:hypothetical protein